MNLADRIKEIEAFPFCKQVIKTEDVSNENDKMEFGYSVKHVHFFDVSGSVMTVTKAPLYVLNEGTEKEEAFFVDKYPQSRVKGNTLEREYVEESDGSIKEVQKLSTSTGEEKVITETVLKSADTVVKG